MMRNTPPCPRCGEDSLTFYRAMNEMRLICIECSWRTTEPLVAGVDIDDAIAAAVKAAKKAEAGAAFFRELSERQRKNEE